MKKTLFTKLIITAVLGIILFSCETDEPPSIKEDISGVWVLEELYSITYQNETEVIYEEDLLTYEEEIEFFPEGLYIVNYDEDSAYNSQLAFAFAGNALNYPDSTYSEVFGETKIFGTWESHINVDGDNILHFDKWVEGNDSFMFLDNVDENNLTMTMKVNQYYSDVNISNFESLAKYEAIYYAQVYSDYFEDFVTDDFLYEEGYDVGEIIGFYEGYNLSIDDFEAHNFILYYGYHYYTTFFEYYDETYVDIDFVEGFWTGYVEGSNRGETEAMKHNNDKVKSVTLTYKLRKK